MPGWGGLDERNLSAMKLVKMFIKPNTRARNARYSLAGEDSAAARRVLFGSRSKPLTLSRKLSAIMALV
jgi:hypothetical protein